MLHLCEGEDGNGTKMLATHCVRITLKYKNKNKERKNTYLHLTIVIPKMKNNKKL